MIVDGAVSRCAETSFLVDSTPANEIATRGYVEAVRS
jgi:hypothetical protein